MSRLRAVPLRTYRGVSRYPLVYPAVSSALDGAPARRVAAITASDAPLHHDLLSGSEGVAYTVAVHARWYDPLFKWLL